MDDRGRAAAGSGAAEPDYLPATDMPRFIREMMEFVDLAEGDVAAIRRSAPIVLRHAERLTAALYEHFLAFPRSAKFFSTKTAASTPSGSTDASIASAGGYGSPPKWR